ncbi:MAG: SprB repeat-containing protein [Sphingobacteriales bacterium]|nr:SprB repeat-containing protein [Sphingobacteriales bacterium]
MAYTGDINLIANFIGEDNLPVYCNDALINLSPITAFNSDANFTQVYLVTDTLGNIAQIHNTLPIPAPPAGIWKIAALNYQNDNITGLVVDNNLSDLAGCYNVSYSDKFVALPNIEMTYTIEYVGTDQIVHVQVSGGYPVYYGYVDTNVNLPPLSPTYDLDLGYATFELTFSCNSQGSFNFWIYSDGALCDEFITVNLVANCPPPININIEITSITPTTTCNTCDGTINVNVSNGTAPYAYTWSNGSITQNQANLCAGTYTLTVTDANGNTATTSTVVSSLNTPVISNISLDCNLGASSITVFATDPNGETLEYALTVSNYQSSNTFTTIPNGNYSVLVRNTISSCVIAQNFTVDCFPIINITPTTTPTSTCNMCDATIDITVDGGTAPYAYLWSNGSIAQNQNTLCTGTIP